MSELPLSTSAVVKVATPDEFNVIVAGWHVAVGAVLSITVTVAVQVEAFPLASVPVNITVFPPRLAHVNAVCDKVNVNPQLSVLPPSISAVVTEALPDASKNTVTDWQDIVGAVTSWTVTVAVAVEVFPLASTPVNVTVFVPRLAHVNVVTSKLNDTEEQLSVLPLSISAVVIDAFPDASKFTVTFCTTIIGAAASTTVTIEVHVEDNPFASVAVSVTVFVPMLAHVNVVCDKLKLTEQLSELPLSTSAVVKVATPDASNVIVAGWHVAIGAVLSITVTVAVQVEAFPFTSITVKVTELVPKSAQVKLYFDKYIVSIAQLSKLPFSISANVIEALPIESKNIVSFLHIAVGTKLSTIKTIEEQDDVLPELSVAVNVIPIPPAGAVTVSDISSILKPDGPVKVSGTYAFTLNVKFWPK